MPNRKYTNLKVLLPEIQEMLAQGKSHREITENLGLTGERPIHHLLKQSGTENQGLHPGFHRNRKAGLAHDH